MNQTVFDEQRNEVDREADWLAATERHLGSALVQLALVLPEGRHYVASLRKTVRCLLESVSVRREDIEDIELAIGELAANAITHGDAPFTLSVNYHTDRVVLMMADNGSGMVATGGTYQDFVTPMPSVSDLGKRIQRPLPSDTPESLEAPVERFGGWGLPVVRRIMDQVEVLSRQPRGTIIRAEKRLRPEPYLF